MYPNQQNPRPSGGTGAPYPPYPQQTPYNAGGAYPQQQQQQQPPYNNPSQYGIAAGLAGGYQQNMSAPRGNNQSGYPPQSGGYPPQSGGYPPQSGGNPPQSGGYPPQSGGYPPQSGGYPPQSGGYPPQSGGYPPQSGGYPPQSGGYPPQSGSYPPQGGSYPPQSGGYPGQQQSYPSQGGYPGAAQGGGFGGPGMGPAAAGGFGPNDPRSQQLNQVLQRYEINQQFGARLNALSNCEIVILCDDSGSMNTPLDGSNQTRWDELKSLVNIVIDISAVMDANGVDIYFLNRDPILNVNNPQNIRHIFNSPPQGLTPLVPALRRILAAKRGQAFEKKLLILIATDGAPTNDRGDTDIGTLEAVLRNERTPQTYITFLACTDDLAAVNYLSNWDKSMPNLDVVDDYRSERAEIQRIRGATFPFSYGDFIVKALLGSIDPWFDALDERA